MTTFVAKANDNDSLIPEIWSREALMTLMSNTSISAELRPELCRYHSCAS